MYRSCREVVLGFASIFSRMTKITPAPYARFPVQHGAITKRISAGCRQGRFQSSWSQSNSRRRRGGRKKGQISRRGWPQLRQSAELLCIRRPTDTDLAVLRTEELAGLEVLFFVGWHDLGRSLVSARLPAETAGASHCQVRAGVQPTVASTAMRQRPWLR